MAVTGAGAIPAQPVYATRAGRWGWALFDWANQPYYTVVTTFLFAPYFTSFVYANGAHGQAVWGYTQAFAGVVIAVASPFLGAIADASGPRKPWIALFTAVSVASCALLWLAAPNAELLAYPEFLRDLIYQGGLLGEVANGLTDPKLFLVLLALVVAAIGVEFATLYNNAMLPHLVPQDRLGLWSGIGWGIGYVGGLVALIIVLFGFSNLLISNPLMPLDLASHQPDRITGPLSALWFAVFVIPMFLFTPDAGPTGLSHLAAAKAGIARLVETAKRLPSYKNILIFLVAKMVYGDAIIAIIGFGGIYAAGVLGWSQTEIGVYGVIVGIIAAIGCIVAGWIEDRTGSRRMILVSLFGLIFACIAMVSVTNNSVLFVFKFDTSQRALKPAPAEALRELNLRLRAAVPADAPYMDKVVLAAEAAAAFAAAEGSDLPARNSSYDSAVTAADAAANAVIPATKDPAVRQAQQPLLQALADLRQTLAGVPESQGLFPRIQDKTFLLFTLVLGFFFGPAQAATRTLMAKLSPPSMAGEFFGLFNLSGKATAFLAPLVVAVFTDGFDSQRAGFAAIILFFIVGLIMFWPVKEEQAEEIH